MKPKQIERVAGKYPTMPDFTPSNSKNVKQGYSKKHKFLVEFYGIHVGFRKGMDSYTSSIAWTCLSFMQDPHLVLLMDTMEKVLPKYMNKDDPTECSAFSSRMCLAWDIFFDRLEGFTITKPNNLYSRYVTNNFDRSISSERTTQPEYYAHLSNLRAAIMAERKNEGDSNVFTTFPYYMYA
jgi:hypothetical protein